MILPLKTKLLKDLYGSKYSDNYGRYGRILCEKTCEKNG